MKLDYPATTRNGAFIQEVLERHLPAEGLVLEVASGSGQHVLRFAEAFQNLEWQPSDPEDEARRSIDAYRADADRPNLRAAVVLDASADEWPVDRADVVLCANMIHIAPWSAAQGLFAGAKRILSERGMLILYGPYKKDGRHTSDSNVAFDESLKRRNPEWGVRDMADVEALGAPELELIEVAPMPANNFMLMFRRR